MDTALPENGVQPPWNLPDLAAERTVYAIDALGDAGLSVQTRAIANGADQA